METWQEKREKFIDNKPKYSYQIRHFWSENSLAPLHPHLLLVFARPPQIRLDDKEKKEYVNRAQNNLLSLSTRSGSFPK